MKKQILLFCMLLQVWRLSAGTMQEAFLKGNSAYMAGAVQEALKLYQSIEPKGSAVWYNMGNCYYRLQNLPEAIVHWRRSQKDASWHDFTTLENYIAQSYQALGVVYNKTFIARIHLLCMRCGLVCSLFVLQLLFLCCLFFLFVILPRMVKQSRYFSMTLLIVCTLSVGLVMVVNYYDQKYPYGIVTKNSISVYAGPGIDYAQLTEAKMLDNVRIYLQRDGWLKVRVGHYGYGWIQEAELAVI